MNKMLIHMKSAIAIAVASAVVGTSAHAVTFSTFVPSSSINAVEGQNNTIAFNYAGNKFVGSVYTGPNNLQLYSTNLSGGNVQKFGAPIPGSFSGEVVLAASLGQDSFNKGDIYAGAGAQIYHFSNDVSTQVLFASVPDGATVRQILFDPGSSFGGAMLVTTTLGHVYSFDAAGNATLIASTGEDTEGMDIAPSSWGKYAGDLLTTSEGSGFIRAITPGGAITVISSAPVAETVSVVPDTLNPADPLQGFYVANYPVDIQFAAAGQFTGIEGDAIVTSEQGSNAQVWDLHYTGDNTPFTINLIGNLPNQSEDGIFVTGQRESEVGVPEPGIIALLGAALAGIRLTTRRRQVK